MLAIYIMLATRGGGSLQQSIVAVGTESQVGEAVKGGFEAPVEKVSIENLEEVAAKGALVEEENQTAEHRQSAIPLDSEEEDLQLEGGGYPIMDDFDRPVVSPKAPPDKKTSSSKKTKKR
ncbi:hypothetical protein U1Q18_040509 [Sarracenia purpurea var. burkii]